MKTANTIEVTQAAQEAAQRDTKKDICNPDGAWYNWKNINNVWNPYSGETSLVASREAPIAYKLFVSQYLMAQGWKR